MTNEIAERISRHAIALGFDVERKGSNLSKSAYITCSLGDAIVKIRISDHDLPPTYGALNGDADYEIGPHSNAHPDGWAGVVRALAEKAGLPTPASAKAAITKKNRDRDRQELAELKISTAKIKHDLDAAIRDERVACYFQKEWADAIAEKDGATRREKKRLLRRRWERESGSGE